MSVRLLVGPSGSGKTRAAQRFAFAKAQVFERVVVLTLPSQRLAWLEGLAGLGSSLGVEVTNLQNLCYRMLDRLGRNKAVVLNPGRVALTARALERVLGREVQAGEARLYAQAIAECKRALFVPKLVGEQFEDWLALVYAEYQGLLHSEGLQDLDDVRLRAAELLETEALSLGAHFIVDGYRTFNASEFVAIKAIARGAFSSLLTLPFGAPDSSHESWAHPVRFAELQVMQQALGAKLERLEASGKPWAGLAKSVQLRASANPVSEARAALRQVKSWLLAGVEAFSIALIVPSHVSARVLEALAREYHVPLAPESLGGLLDSAFGQVLDAALTAPMRDFPAPELRVLSFVFPELELLASTLEKRGLHGGSSAYRGLLDAPEFLAAWRVLDDLRTWFMPPETDFVAWFEVLLERLIPSAAWLESARVLAREAARLLPVSGGGSQFAQWLRTLLEASALPHPDAARGVAVLTPVEASGRRFKRVVVLGVTEGAYQNLEVEDFFVPEDARVGLEKLLERKSLPWRMNGLADSLLYDALTRADETLIISFPKAERGASLAPHPRLARLGLKLETELRETAGLLELAHTQNPVGTLVGTSIFRTLPRSEPFTALELEAVGRCGLRAWAGRVLPKTTDLSLLPSLALKNLRRHQKDTSLLERAPKNLQANLERFDPSFLALLEAQVETTPTDQLQPFVYTSKGIEFVLDGLVRRNDSNGKVKQLEVYRRVDDLDEAWELFRDSTRHREWWFADFAIESGVRVAFWAIDTAGNRKQVLNPAAEKSQKRRFESRAILEKARSDLTQGLVRAIPGFHCRTCAYQDLCREVV
jgi:ATP-dependent helicase/nuclease subunit B